MVILCKAAELHMKCKLPVSISYTKLNGVKICPQTRKSFHKGVCHKCSTSLIMRNNIAFLINFKILELSAKTKDTHQDKKKFCSKSNEHTNEHGISSR